MNYSQTLDYIHSLGNFSKPPTLERITAVLKNLGQPQNFLPAIHIAGTNGKGSVCSMLAKIFLKAGLKTGLFISPFIIDFRERIQINGEYISEDDLVKYSEIVRLTGVELTEFEFITAVSFIYFRDKKIDILIAETGLGGKLDATNALSSVKLAVITKIGLDHTAVLGDTIEKIAAEKCGIIKDCPVVSSPCQNKSALRVISKYTDNLTVPDLKNLEKINSSGNSFYYKNKHYSLSLMGDYQTENALTVIEAVSKSGYNIPYETVKSALADTFFPARMEIISRTPLVILDGAHNPDGAAALAAELKKCEKKPVAVIGMMRDKDYKTVLKTTLPFCKSAVSVTVSGMSRSLDSVSLCAAANEFCPCISANSYDDAIKKAGELSSGSPLFVFGSLYLAAGIREKLKIFYI